MGEPSGLASSRWRSTRIGHNLARVGGQRLRPPKVSLTCRLGACSSDFRRASFSIPPGGRASEMRTTPPSRLDMAASEPAVSERARSEPTSGIRVSAPRKRGDAANTCKLQAASRHSFHRQRRSLGSSSMCWLVVLVCEGLEMKMFNPLLEMLLSHEFI